jgi:hypothetical protein
MSPHEAAVMTVLADVELAARRRRRRAAGLATSTVASTDYMPALWGARSATQLPLPPPSVLSPAVADATLAATSTSALEAPIAVPLLAADRAASAAAAAKDPECDDGWCAVPTWPPRNAAPTAPPEMDSRLDDCTGPLSLRPRQVLVTDLRTACRLVRDFRRAQAQLGVTRRRERLSFAAAAREFGIVKSMDGSLYFMPRHGAAPTPEASGAHDADVEGCAADAAALEALDSAAALSAADTAAAGGALPLQKQLGRLVEGILKDVVPSGVEAYERARADIEERRALDASHHHPMHGGGRAPPQSQYPDIPPLPTPPTSAWLMRQILLTH